MELDVLTAISPIDGRYRGKTKALAAYFSEFALIKYRVQVEVEYFITLCELPLPQLKGIDSNVYETLRNIYRNFSEADAQRIKDIESVTNHDVKAVEYFLKDGISFLGMSDVIEKTMERVAFIANPTYDDYVATDAEARKIAASLI